MTEMSPQEGMPPRAQPWYRRTWVVATATGLIAFLVGAGAGVAGTADVTSTPEYQAVAEERDTTQSELEEARSEIEGLRSDLEDSRAEIEKIEGNLPEREAAVKEARQKLTQRRQEVRQREKDVKQAEQAVRKREKKVGIIEQEIQNNTVSGEGLYEVGADMKPGQYKSSGSSGCYYAVLNSPDTGDIAQNANTDGPAIVELSSGQYFETARCAEWVLQR